MLDLLYLGEAGEGRNTGEKGGSWLAAERFSESDVGKSTLTNQKKCTMLPVQRCSYPNLGALTRQALGTA